MELTAGEQVGVHIHFSTADNAEWVFDEAGSNGEKWEIKNAGGAFRFCFDGVEVQSTQCSRQVTMLLEVEGHQSVLLWVERKEYQNKLQRYFGEPNEAEVNGKETTR